MDDNSKTDKRVIELREHYEAIYEKVLKNQNDLINDYEKKLAENRQ